MNSDETILIGADPDEAIRLAAEQVVAALEGNVRARCVALAGGRTPAALYAALTRPPWRDRVDWSAVRWFWGDERAVPPDHPHSNYHMACETLLKPLGVVAKRIHRMPADADDLPAATREYEQAIREHVPAGPDGLPVFDLVLPGVGTDGHTASLFPSSAGLAAHHRLVVAHEVPSLGAWRMTLTLPLLRVARRIVVLIIGADKAAIMSQVLAPQADPARLPAAGLRGTAGRVVWILDREASRLVHPSPPV